MKLTREWVDTVVPHHGRTSCNDDNLANGFGGWEGKYDRNTGHKEIRYPRCHRCYLLDHLGMDLESLAFEVLVSLRWKDE